MSAPIPGCVCCSSGFICGSCSVPKANLTISWTNSIFGSGSDTLVWNGVNEWNSGCSGAGSAQLLFQLLCGTDPAVEFRVYYPVSGACPDGQTQYCSTFRSSPFGLTQTGLTCGDSFLLTVTCGSACTTLDANGYTGFTVSA